MCRRMLIYFALHVILNDTISQACIVNIFICNGMIHKTDNYHTYYFNTETDVGYKGTINRNQKSSSSNTRMSTTLRHK